MDYLGQSEGILLVQKTRDPIEFYKRIAAKIDVQVICVDTLKDAGAALKSHVEPVDLHPGDVNAWRFAFWVERHLQRRLKTRKKANVHLKSYVAVDDYLFQFGSKSFFVRNVVDRAKQLYEAFREYVHLSAKMTEELAGGSFDSEVSAIRQEAFSAAYYDGKVTDLAISTFAEHKGRLAVLKSAVEYKVFLEKGIDHAKKQPFKFGEFEFEIDPLTALPRSFQEALDALSKEPHYYLYPVVWQWFLGVFGGFVVKDYEDQEMDMLAQKARIPKESARRALSAFDKLFPTPDGWFTDLTNSNIRILKLMPLPLMGIGAIYRRFVYAGAGPLSKLNLSGLFTRKDLLKWNNAAVSFLAAAPEAA